MWYCWCYPSLRRSDLALHIFMCNLAAERSGAKSESEFREAKVKCTQSHLLLWFYLLNAFQISLLVIDRKCSLCAGTCFDWWKQTIGLVDGCLVGQNPIHHPTIIWKRGTALGVPSLMTHASRTSWETGTIGVSLIKSPAWKADLSG